MAHWSENSRRLKVETHFIAMVAQCGDVCRTPVPAVHLFRFPAGRNDTDGARSDDVFRTFANMCSQLHPDSTVCVLTTPPDAARLLPYLESALHFQLWIAVKTNSRATPATEGILPHNHASLLVLTRYPSSLRHTKTRIQYTYCPACGRTTKDYGGKKHVYHEYGTLMSDVWRDFKPDSTGMEAAVIDRLQDLFGLEPYETLHVYEMQGCTDLLPRPAELKEVQMSIQWQPAPIQPETRLINADCLQALRTIPDNSIDFCFADPPYNIQKKYDHWNDALETVEYFRWCDQWLAELARVLKPGHTLAVINIPLWAVRHYQHLASILCFQSWIAWEALSFPVRMIMPAHYAILCFSKGEPRPLPGLSGSQHSRMDRDALTSLAEGFCLRASCISRRRKLGLSDEGELSDLWYDIHRLKHNSRRVDHPCQLPPKLMQRLFALFTRPGETVLDCFNGAGTSTLVAQQMGREFIGIELSPQYHELALQRHEQLKYGQDPFGKQDGTPAAKNSPVDRLPKQKYAVSKKTLQLEIKRIARELGRLPTRAEVEVRSQYPMDYYDRYFISWGEVCAAARTTGMSDLPLDGKNESLQLGLKLDVT